MKRIIFSLFLLSAILRLSAQEGKKIVILHTNDMHSHLYGFSPESAYSPLVTGNDSTRGGFARIAAILKNERDLNKGITLTIDAGDFLMGTLFHAVESKTGFQLPLMKRMGYDIVCLGNHEFDFGPAKLADIIVKSAGTGPVPGILYGNVLFNDKDPDDDSLEKLNAEKTIQRTMIIERDGLKIGFFSLMGKDAVDVAPLARPVTFEKQIPFAKEMVKELKQANCDIIICLSHSGVSKDKDGNWAGEDVELAKSVSGINVIISGHTHSMLDKPLIINGVPVVQAGDYGQFVGRLSLSLVNGNLHFDDYSLIPVNDKIQGDSETETLINNQAKKIDKEILSRLGVKYFDQVAEADFLLECNEQGNFRDSNLGPLVADAIHSYVNQHSAGGTDVSMVAVGIIRDRIVPGIVAAPDIFRVMSLGSGEDEMPGYPLARLYVTGKELKNILEILQVAYKSTPGNYCFFSGLKVDYNPEKGLLRKIKHIEINGSDGTVKKVDFSKKNKSLYSITANSYMLEFIGIIKKKSFGLINVVPKDSSGTPVKNMKTAVIDINPDLPGIQEGKEWLALLEYISSMKDSDGDGIPEVEKKYSVPVRSFFTENR